MECALRTSRGTWADFTEVFHLYRLCCDWDLSFLSRSLVIKCSSYRQAHWWRHEINLLAENCDYLKEQRFDGFAPPRENTLTKWSESRRLYRGLQVSSYRLTYGCCLKVREWTRLLCRPGWCSWTCSGGNFHHRLVVRVILITLPFRKFIWKNVPMILNNNVRVSKWNIKLTIVSWLVYIFAKHFMFFLMINNVSKYYLVNSVSGVYLYWLLFKYLGIVSVLKYLIPS